jgi:hypothetical protein
LRGRPRRTVGVKILRPKGPILGPIYRRPHSTHMVLIPTVCHFCFCYFETRVLKETLCWWQSRTLLVSIVRRRPVAALAL